MLDWPLKNKQTNKNTELYLWTENKSLPTVFEEAYIHKADHWKKELKKDKNIKKATMFK